MLTLQMLTDHMRGENDITSAEDNFSFLSYLEREGRKVKSAGRRKKAGTTYLERH